MPRNAATNRFRIRNQNASIFINGTDGAAGNALSIANNASLSPTAAVTLEIRFRPTARKAAILFDNSTLGVTNSYYLSISAGGGLYWFSTIGGVAKNILGTTTKVKFDEWNMVNATYDGAAIKLFLNGSQLAETLAATGSMGTNSGPLRIGAYYSGGTSQTFQGSISQPRVYATGCTLAEHQDRYYRSITSAALQAALVLDLNTERGASSTSNALSGLGNNATLGASASWTSDSPFKSRKASVNANLVKNGDFEYAPPFTAATNTGSRWIDGTAAGSTTNDTYRWYFILGVGNVQASFDTTVNHSGNASLKIEATNTTGRGRVLHSPFEATTTPQLIRQYGIPVLPNTTYTFSGWIKTLNVVSNSIRFQVLEYDSNGTSGASSNTSFAPAGTADWTQYTFTFTTASTAAYIHVKCDMAAAGAAMTAWYDDVTILPVYPEGRVSANGNLVKNADFEVAPSFVAATTTQSRWVDGTAAGSTTNATYKWKQQSGANATAVSFDSSVTHGGLYSLKVSATDTLGSTYVDVGAGIGASQPVATLNSFAIPVTGGISYTLTGWVKSNNVPSNGAFLQLTTYNSAGTRIDNVASSVKLSGTQDWTQITITQTVGASAAWATIGLMKNVAGNISDAWFDDLWFGPTTNPGRVVIT